MDALLGRINSVMRSGEGVSMASREVPVYHVCQHCGGDGCSLCSDLMILEGDIQLDPEWDDELPPVKSAWKPAYEFIVVWKEDGKPFNKCFTNESDSVVHFESLIGRASSLYMVYPDGHSRVADLSGASK